MFLKRFVVAVALIAFIMPMTVSVGAATFVTGQRPASSIPHAGIGLIAASGSKQNPEQAAKESPDEDSLLGLIQPYLEQIRPYLAPIEAFLREQATAFKAFVIENMPSGNRRGQPRAVIDLPPPSK